MKRTGIVIVLFFLLVSELHAEGYYTRRERPDHLMFHVTPAFTLLNYKSAESRSLPSLNGSFGVEYAHFFGLHLGVSIGADISSFSSFYAFGGRRDSLQMFDNWSSLYYKLRQNLTTKEYQRVTYYAFPLKLHLRMLASRTLVFNVSGGLQYSIYASEKQAIVGGTVDRSAYFDDIHVDIDEFYPLLFGKFNRFINPSPQRQFKKTMFAVAQAGFSFRLAEDLNMHTELNFQYGLKNIKTRNINLLVPDEYAGVTATNFIGNIRPISLGLKIGITYTFDLFNVDCKCHNPLM